MAQVFPLTADHLAGEGDRHSLAETLAALPEPWTLLLNRRIGAESSDPAAIVLVHPDIGIALVNEVVGDCERDANSDIAALHSYLEEQRFGEFFPGDLPIVALAVAAEDLPVVGDRLAAAFEEAPRLSITDHDWADAVVELLLLPDDLEMAPPADEAIDPPLEAPPPDPALSEPEGREPEAAPPLMLDHATASEAGGEKPLPLLMADWPMVANDEPNRWRGRAAIVALLVIFFGGAGVAAWRLNGDHTALSSPPPLAPSERVVLALPHPPQHEAPHAAPMVAESKPPPLPAAPPIVMAAKPLASPPPPPPKPTAVEALPSVAIAPPPASPPASVAAAEPPSATKESPKDVPEQQAETPRSTAVARPQQPRKPSAPAARAPVMEAGKPQRVAKATPPPVRTQAPQEPEKRRAERPQEEMRGPPIDAADLPPLPPSAASQDHPRNNVEAPRLLASPRAQGGEAVALGPPVPLGPTVAKAPAASARECRPYTSDTSLIGRGLPVQGIACRGSDGQWRLVSEVPLR